MAFYCFCEHEYIVCFLGRVIIIYVFQATKIEWGKCHGAIPFQAPHISSFLYIDTSNSLVVLETTSILDCSEMRFCLGFSLEEDVVQRVYAAFRQWEKTSVA